MSTLSVDLELIFCFVVFIIWSNLLEHDEDDDDDTGHKIYRTSFKVIINFTTFGSSPFWNPIVELTHTHHTQTQNICV